VVAEPLTQRHEFTDNISVSVGVQPDGRDEHVVQLEDASRIAVAEITVAPGGRFPWHTHPGPALAAVTSNELIYIYADDCVERSYPAGTAFVDPGGDNVHTAYNPSDTEPTTVMVTFLGVPPEGPLTVPVDEGEGAALDERCDVDF
jgi:quercetin dioxygenase-like cupin family protein